MRKFIEARALTIQLWEENRMCSDVILELLNLLTLISNREERMRLILDRMHNLEQTDAIKELYRRPGLPEEFKADIRRAADYYIICGHQGWDL